MSDNLRVREVEQVIEALGKADRLVVFRDGRLVARWDVCNPGEYRDREVAFSASVGVELFEAVKQESLRALQERLARVKRECEAYRAARRKFAELYANELAVLESAPFENFRKSDVR